MPSPSPSLFISLYKLNFFLALLPFIMTTNINSKEKHFANQFLGSGPNRGQSPVEWEDFPSVCPLRSQEPARQASEPSRKASESARLASELASQTSEPASQASELASQASEPGWLVLRPGWLVLRPAWLALRPAGLALRPDWF